MWLALLALWPVLYGSILCHELGHAFGGWLAGAIVTSCGVGTARPFWVGRRFRTRFYLCLRGWQTGLTYAVFPTFRPSRPQWITYLAGGMTANAVLAGLGAALWLNIHWGDPVWLMMAAINLLLLLQAAMPVTVRAGFVRFRTDGAQIMHVLRHGVNEANPQGIMQSLASLESLWRAIDDNRTLLLHGAAAAMYWAEMEAFVEAEHYIRLADSLPPPLEPYLRGFTLLCRGHALAVMGRQNESAAVLDSAAQNFAQLNLDEGLRRIDWVRGILRLHSGDAVEADKILEAVANQSFALQNRRARLELLVARALAANAAGKQEHARELRAEYEQLRDGNPLAIRDLTLYRSLARQHAQRGEVEQAAACYMLAIATARDLHPAFTPDDQPRFLASQLPLANEALACLANVGNHDAITRITHFFSGAEACEHLAQVDHKRDRRYYQMSWLMVGLNFVAVGAMLRLVPYREHLLRTLIALPMMFTAVGAFLGIARFLPAPLAPWARSRLGRIMWALMWIGWLAAALIFAIFVLAAY